MAEKRKAAERKEKTPTPVSYGTPGTGNNIAYRSDRSQAGCRAILDGWWRYRGKPI